MSTATAGVPQSHRVAPGPLVRTRNDYLLQQCRGLNVLHLGCATSGYTVESMTSGRQLHLLLLRVARRVIGVDIDTTNLETMRKAGLTDLIEWDVEKLDQLDVPGPIDVIIAGDIVEHLSNPGMAMSAMHAQMKRLSCRAIITVPNAFSLKHFLPLALLRKELVMPDHVCYYSLTTLRGLLSRSNLRIVETAMYSTADRIPSTGRRLIQTFADKTVLRFAPQLADGIIVVVEAA